MEGVAAATGSLRQAADLLHLHHSSIARRLEQLGKTLGIELTQPTGLTRARLALTTWRLLDGMGRTGSGSVLGPYGDSGSTNQQWRITAPGDRLTTGAGSHVEHHPNPGLPPAG